MLSCAQLHIEVEKGVNHMVIDADDADNYDMSQHFNDTYDFIY